MKKRRLKDSARFPEWMGKVQAHLQQGSIRMDRAADARYQRRSLGVTLWQLRVVAEELIRKGLASFEPGSRGEVWLVREQ
jgi:hypothetical protein